MEREYICIDCGGTFVLDTKNRCAAKRCPECARLRTNFINGQWRERERQKAFNKMRNQKV